MEASRVGLFQRINVLNVIGDWGSCLYFSMSLENRWRNRCFRCSSLCKVKSDWPWEPKSVWWRRPLLLENVALHFFPLRGLGVNTTFIYFSFFIERKWSIHRKYRVMSSSLSTDPAQHWLLDTCHLNQWNTRQCQSSQWHPPKVEAPCWGHPQCLCAVKASSKHHHRKHGCQSRQWFLPINHHQSITWQHDPKSEQWWLWW